jgi:hypothetical protein
VLGPNSTVEMFRQATLVQTTQDSHLNRNCRAHLQAAVHGKGHAGGDLKAEKNPSNRPTQRGYSRRMSDEASPVGQRLRTAEVIAALSIATDLGIGVPLEHGLHSTLIAMRLCDRLGVDSETASQTYYSCLLFYIGCTAGAELAAEFFGDDDALTTYATPRRFGSRLEMMTGFMRALAPPGNRPPIRALQIARGLPRAVAALKRQVAAQCEVGQMLTDRLGLPMSIQGLFAHLAERWDGKGEPGRAERDDIPLPVRIVHVARDAAFQRMLGGEEFAASVIRERGGALSIPP